MKKVIVVLLCMASMSAIAQREERQQRGGPNQMTPEQTATLRTKKMALALDLTDAQQKQMQTLNLENAKTRQAAMEKRKARKENGESKKPTSDERYAMKNERLDRMIAQKTQIKEILSNEQYAKWEKIAQRKGKHRKGMKDKERKHKSGTRK